jgi:ADP-ribose pyrophosphatase YjhB (NUDIX family)
MAPQPTIGVKAVIIKHDHLLTIFKHNSDNNTAPLYILPGGKLEYGERLDEGLRRECREEIGTEITVGPLIIARDFIEHHWFPEVENAVHVVDLIFQCDIPDHYTPQFGSNPDPEQQAVVWLPLATLHEYPFFPATLTNYLVNLPTTTIYHGEFN